MCVFVLALEWFWVSLTAFFVCVSVSWGVLVVLSPFFVYVYICLRMHAYVFSFFLSSVNMFGIRSS